MAEGHWRGAPSSSSIGKCHSDQSISRCNGFSLELDNIEVSNSQKCTFEFFLLCNRSHDQSCDISYPDTKKKIERGSVGRSGTWPTCNITQIVWHHHTVTPRDDLEHRSKSITASPWLLCTYTVSSVASITQLSRLLSRVQKDARCIRYHEQRMSAADVSVTISVRTSLCSSAWSSWATRWFSTPACIE